MGTEGLADAAIRAGRPLIAAIYNRVSKDRAKTQRSVGEQDTENRVACEDNDWTIGDTYVDNYRSASRHATKAREDWPRLLADLAAGRIHVLVLWEVSRGDRDDLGWIRLLHQCRDLGVLIHITSHDHTYDPRKRRDYKTLASEGLDAADESERTRERILRTVRRTAANGRPHGKILFGYKREYELVDGAPKMVRQVEDPETAPIVREAARRIEAGETAYAVCEDFARRGILTSTGKAWEAGRIKDMLLNPGYVSKRVHRGEVIGDADWPPILKRPDGSPDEALHYRLVARLTDPARGRYREPTVRHLLSRIVLCGVCGGVCTVIPNRGRPSYQCNGRGVRTRRPGVNDHLPEQALAKRFHVVRLESRVDEHVVDLIAGRLSRPDAVEMYASSAAADENLRRWLDEAAEKRARLETFYDRAAEGALSDVAIARIEQRMLPEIEAAERNARQVHLSPVVLDLIKSDPQEVIAEWRGKSLAQQREVVRALTARIEILPVGRGRRGASPWEGIRVAWRGDS